MPAPSPEDLAPLLAETNSLDDPIGADQPGEEDGEFMAAARAAVGNDAKATALQDAIMAVLRKQGLLADEPDTDAGAEPDDGDASDVGSGFGDY